MAEVHIVTSSAGIEGVFWDEESAWNEVEKLKGDEDGDDFFIDVYQVKGEPPRYIR